VGSPIHDSATLSNVTANAGGTVTYSVYTDNTCHTPFGGAGIKNVTNGVVPDSDVPVFNAPGTFYWQAVYSGDANNSVATSTCGSEILTVQAIPNTKNNPTITTSLSTTSASMVVGQSIFDTATLAGATANAGGSVKYTVYSNNSCSTLWANAGSQTVTNGIVPNSAPVLFDVTGTFYWQVVYSGDANNNAATSTCTSEVITVTAIPTNTPPTGSGTLSGVVFNDKNTNGARDAGEEGLAGFVINLYQGANFNGGLFDPILKTTTSDANGAYTFSGLTNGTYSIEQLGKNGWKQTTDDFATVVLSGSVGINNLNFGDMAKNAGNQNCEKRDGKGRGHGRHVGCVSTSTPPVINHDDNDDNEDDNDEDNHQSSSTISWWGGAHDNGLHLGWTIGRGGHGGEGRGHGEGNDD
jgi:hypothetical protein